MLARAAALRHLGKRGGLQGEFLARRARTYLTGLLGRIARYKSSAEMVGGLLERCADLDRNVGGQRSVSDERIQRDLVSLAQRRESAGGPLGCNRIVNSLASLEPGKSPRSS